MGGDFSFFDNDSICSDLWNFSASYVGTHKLLLPFIKIILNLLIVFNLSPFYQASGMRLGGEAIPTT
ncbi:hypothetical protein A4U60_08050 [Priestia endophytica]|nr:hypothetical protein A4U60_08050 [Priestia endophytica]